MVVLNRPHRGQSGFVRKPRSLTKQEQADSTNCLSISKKYWCILSLLSHIRCLFLQMTFHASVCFELGTSNFKPSCQYYVAKAWTQEIVQCNTTKENTKMFWVCRVLSKSLYWKQLQLKILYKLFSLNTSNTQKRFCRTESLSAGFTSLPLLHWSNCLIGPLCKIWVSLGRNCEQALLLKWKWHMGEDPQNNADNPEKQNCFLVQCILIIIFTLAYD